MSIEIYSVGDRGITLATKGAVTLDIQQRIWWISTELTASEDTQVIDIIPGTNSLTLTINPYADCDKQALITRLTSLWHQSNSIDLSNHFKGKTIEVPVIYGGEKGPDLSEVAAIHNLTPMEVIQRHTAPLYTVYFIGFMPGFVYLGGLDSSLETPRRAEPRLKIPAGSVGIGGAQTGVYPAESPGGWQIIGNTSLAFFDATREHPSLFLPGDQLKFIAEEILL